MKHLAQRWENGRRDGKTRAGRATGFRKAAIIAADAPGRNPKKAVATATNPMPGQSPYTVHVFIF
jgi:hypothetical protein